jgi:16S rRNA processing protein RimM
VKVVVLTDFPDRFEPGNSVRLRMPKGETASVRIAKRRAHRGGLLLKLDGVDNRPGAEARRDAEIVIAPGELGELAEGSFYIFDLIGLKVTSEDGRECGEVTDVIQAGANDVYVTSTGLCIPALKNVVAKVDLERGEMIIRPVPGLLPDKQ